MHKYLRHSQTNAKPHLLFNTAELMECSFKANNKVPFGRGSEKHFLLKDDYEDSSFLGCECHLFSAYFISIIFSSNASTTYPNITPTTKPENYIFDRPTR